jgi:DNA modification methylase
MTTTFNLLLGNCLDRLKELPDNSIDSIVTDPPYGLSQQPDIAKVLRHWLAGDDYKHNSNGFMGKEWDSFVPGPSIWKECYRVLKPGGHMLAFFGTRTYDMGVIAIRLAGFEIRDQLAWVFGSGFPKSRDISKDMDKILGNKREVIGKTKAPGMAKSNVENEQQNRSKYEFEKLGAPVGKEAKQWNGWGTALKPAQEPIVLARKPLEGTVAQNVMTHGVGGINIDSCRVETSESKERTHEKSQLSDYSKTGNTSFASKAGKFIGGDPKGRFPANFIHDGSEEVVSLFPDSDGQIAPVKGTESSHTGQNGIYGTYGRTAFDKRDETEKSAARFFYCAKTSKKDRNEGLDHFPTVTTDPYAQHRGRRMEDNDIRFDGAPPSVGKNNHPTVKPTDLMRYLCRLITPPNGTVLDPFMGSGSTGKAAMYEGFNFIGVELDPEYIKIAEARIQHAQIQAITKPNVTKKKRTTSTSEDNDISKFLEGE